MLDLSSKWSGKLTDAEVTLGMARGWERHSGLVEEFSCGHQGGEMGDGRSGTRLISHASRSLHYVVGIAVFHVHPPVHS